MTLCCALLSPAVAQTEAPQPIASGSSKPTTEMPTVQEPARPAGAEPTGMMGGDKPFFLTTSKDGAVLYNFTQDTNELESISAKVGVVFSSDDMTLNSDELDYNNAKAKLVASGKRVVIRQGEIIATCQLFKYDAKDQTSELAGDPVIYNRTKDGKVTTTSGDTIIIARVDGKPQIQVKGGGRRAPRLDSGRSTVPVPANNLITPPADGPNARVVISDPAEGGSAAPAAKPQESGGMLGLGAPRPR
jgi:hypothetical protein